MTTAAPRRRPLSSYVQAPPIREVHPPGWFARLPGWLSIGAILVGLVLIATFLRTRQLTGQLWFNEAIAIGTASHSLGELPGFVRDAGGAPLYYALLHVWIEIFGSGVAATHALSLVITLIAIPVACWLAWGLGGRRAGIFAATLLAFSAYGTRYAQETQPYALLLLLGLLTTAGFVQAYCHRRRRYLWLFALGLAAMLYTQGSAGLYAFGALVAAAVVHRGSEDRRGLARDLAIGFGGAFVLYLPWLPTTIHQIGHATSPWHYAPVLGADVPAGILGGERVDVALLIAAVVGLTPLVAAAARRSPEALTMWALIALPVAALVLARVGSLASPTWVARYFGAMVAPLLLLAALLSARARLVGVVSIALCIAFVANPSSYVPAHKSDMRDVAAELGTRLHPGDLVVSGQPEQTPLAFYYLPGGLRYASTLGAESDPSTMNWSDAQSRLQGAEPAAILQPLVASLRPGQQLLFMRPLDEGARNWKEPWTKLVRRRSAQWGQILTEDVAAGRLDAVAVAPHNYRSACCVADSAVLYRKTSS
ncbi:MAG: glycosyltransferase family 39 protein [Solirubrobacterales bacterium]|nr:glycosyltransferase family 39 protein [Solirubrobacterales bacterium]